MRIDRTGYGNTDGQYIVLFGPNISVSAFLIDPAMSHEGHLPGVPFVLERKILLGCMFPGEKQAARNCVPPISTEIY